MRLFWWRKNEEIEDEPEFKFGFQSDEVNRQTQKICNCDHIHNVAL